MAWETDFATDLWSWSGPVVESTLLFDDVGKTHDQGSPDLSLYAIPDQGAWASNYDESAATRSLKPWRNPNYLPHGNQGFLRLSIFLSRSARTGLSIIFRSDLIVLGGGGGGGGGGGSTRVRHMNRVSNADFFSWANCSPWLVIEWPGTNQGLI